MFTSIRVSWRPPLTPNGIILSYVVIYRSGIDIPTEITVYLNLSFTISKLSPRTRVPEITVFAVNSAGLGKQATLRDITTLEAPRKIFL